MPNSIKTISTKRKARMQNQRKVDLNDKVKTKKQENKQKRKVKSNKPVKTKSSKSLQSSSLCLSTLKKSLNRSMNKPKNSIKKPTTNLTTNKLDEVPIVHLDVELSANTIIDKNSLAFSDYTTSPWLFHDEGMAQFFFEDDIQIFSSVEITEEHIFDLSEKLFKSDIGKGVFTYFAAKNNIWNKLNLTKEQFANRFSRCSVGEFDKRYRRAQDQVIHLGGPNFIGTFSYTFMDTLHKAYLDRDNNEDIKKEIIHLAFEKLKSGKERDITANWVKEIANNLFGVVETKPKDGKYDFSESEESTENEQEAVNDYDESSTPTAQEETCEATNNDNGKEANNPSDDEPEDDTDYSSRTEATEHKVTKPLTKDANVIRGILKNKIKSFSGGRRTDKKQAAQIVLFLKGYVKRFEKLSGKKTKH
jgi:hypothetical protein